MTDRQKYQLDITDWQLSLNSGTSHVEKTPRFSATYIGNAKWRPHQESNLVISYEDKTYSLRDLPVSIRLCIDAEPHAGFLTLEAGHSGDWKTQGDHIQLTLTTHLHIDASTLATLNGLEFEVGNVVVGDRVGLAGSEAMTNGHMLPIPSYEFQLTNSPPPPRDPMPDRINLLVTQVKTLTVAVVILACFVVFKLFHK